MSITLSRDDLGLYVKDIYTKWLVTAHAIVQDRLRITRASNIRVTRGGNVRRTRTGETIRNSIGLKAQQA